MVQQRRIEKLPDFDYVEGQIKDIQVKGTYNNAGRLVVKSVNFGDLEAAPSGRFWDSLCSRFGFAPSIYKYFSHAEVFHRVSRMLADSQKNSGDQIRVAVQRTDCHTEDGKPLLLAVSSPKKTLVYDDMIKSVLATTNPHSVTYSPGVVTSQHALRRSLDFDIGGDVHTCAVTLETPIDGYGSPAIYLTMIRQVCSNGSVAYTKAFRSGIALGKGDTPPFTLKRTLEAYNNEDGFVLLKERLQTAQRSQASAFEARRLARLAMKLNDADFRSDFVEQLPMTDRKGLHQRLLGKLRERTGDLRTMYGVAQLDSLSEKRLRTLPTKCRVYDLLNLATEVATHQLQPEKSRHLSGFFGTTISSEYDLENSAEQFGEFQDFVDAASKPVAVAAAN